MKYTIAILALVLPMWASASQAEKVTAGAYTSCARWTTINGIEHSKGFFYVLNEDDSMALTVRFYTGSSECEGVGETILHLERFIVEKKVAYKKRIFILEAKNEDRGDYYRMLFSDDSVILSSSDTFPVKIDINRSLLLKKVQ